MKRKLNCPANDLPFHVVVVVAVVVMVVVMAVVAIQLHRYLRLIALAAPQAVRNARHHHYQLTAVSGA